MGRVFMPGIRGRLEIRHGKRSNPWRWGCATMKLEHHMHKKAEKMKYEEPDFHVVPVSDIVCGSALSGETNDDDKIQLPWIPG